MEGGEVVFIMKSIVPHELSNYVKNGDKYTFGRNSIGLQILPISIQLRIFGRF